MTLEQLEYTAKIDAAVADMLERKRFEQMAETPAESAARQQAEFECGEYEILESVHAARRAKQMMADLKKRANVR